MNWIHNILKEKAKADFAGGGTALCLFEGEHNKSNPTQQVVVLRWNRKSIIGSSYLPQLCMAGDGEQKPNMRRESTA